MTTKCIRSFLLWYALVALSACSVSAPTGTSLPAPTGTPLPPPTPVVITQGAYTVTVTHADPLWTYTLETGEPGYSGMLTVTGTQTLLWTYSIATSGPGLAAIEFSSTSMNIYLPRGCALSLPVGTAWQQVDNARGGLSLKATEASGTKDVVFSVDCTGETKAKVLDGPFSRLIITDTQGAHIAVYQVPGPCASTGW